MEESKVEDTTYVNNQNIDTVNDKILELCEDTGYYFVNINEVLSDGNHSLVEGATSDGVHMYETYCKIWLEYLKNHYFSEEDIQRMKQPSSEPATENQTDSSSEPSTETL